MRLISCKKCGAKVSDQYSYCTNCQAPLRQKSGSPEAVKLRSVTTRTNLKASATRPSAATKPKSQFGLLDWLLTPFEALRQESRSPEAVKLRSVTTSTNVMESVTKPSATKPKSHVGLLDWLLTPFEADHTDRKLQTKTSIEQIELKTPREPIDQKTPSQRTERGRKVQPRGERRQGAVTGAFVGFIQGIVVAGFGFIVLSMMQSQLTAFMVQANGPTILSLLPTIWDATVAVVVVSCIIFGVIVGAVLGVVFVAFRKKIPGSSLTRKSVAFSLIFSAISLLIILRSFLDPRTNAVLATTLAPLIPLRLAFFVFPLVECPALGYLFGYLLERRLKAK